MTDDRKAPGQMPGDPDLEMDLTTADLAAAGEHPEWETRREEERKEREKPDEELREVPMSKSRAGTALGSSTSVGNRVASTAGVAAAAAPARETGSLFHDKEASEWRARWDTIQVGFVDEPRRSVEEADHLVAETMKRLAEVFAEERGKLERQWSKGENVSTEDLRIALQRYRSFFGRLLNV